MSEIKRYTAWAAEVALPRGTMVVLASDYDALTKRVAKLEELLRIFQTWLGASRSQCDESGQRLWDRIENSLAGQQQQGEPEWTEDDASNCRCNMRPEPCEKCWALGWRLGAPINPEQPATADKHAALSTALFNALESYEASRGEFSRKDQKIHAKQCELIRQHAAQLLAGQPAALAPAAVVMPERMTTIPEGKTISYAAGYEDALDAVARLNRNTVPLELLERIVNKQDAAAFIGQEQTELHAILGAKP